MRQLLAGALLLLASGAVSAQRVDPSYGLVNGRDHQRLAEGAGLLGSNMLFEFNPGAKPPSVANLSTSMCINGACEQPIFRYVANDATASAWPAGGYGPNLAVAFAGAAPTPDRDTPLLGADEAVKYNAAKGYQSGETSIGDAGTKDIVLEIVMKGHGGTTNVNIDKMTGGTTSGWTFLNAGTITYFFRLAVGGVFVDVQSGDFNDKWSHAILFMRRAGSGQWYVDGAASGSAANLATVTGSATSANALTFGAGVAGANAASNEVIYAAMWTREAWLDTHLQATVASQRFAELTSTKALIARGSAYPTVATHPSGATLTKYTSGVAGLYLMGANWPRVSRLSDGNAYFLSEPAVTNTFLQSRNLGTSWTKLDAGDSIGGSVVTPFGLTSVTAGYIGDATDGDHGVTQAATVTAAVWTMSVIAKAGSKPWAYLSDNTVANATGYFNLSTCATGTKGAGGREIFATSLGNGWCQIGLSFTGTAASHTFAIQAADADSDKTVAGDGAAVLAYFTEMQLENWPHPTSIYPTTTATASRGVDTLRYSGTGNVASGVGSAVCDVLVTNSSHSHPTVVDLVSLTLSNAGGAGARILINANADNARMFVANSGTQADINPGTFDVSTGALRTLGISWNTNDFALYGNGTQLGTDTSGTVPSGLDRIHIGSDNAETAFKLGGGIKRCRIFDRTGIRQ